MSTPALDRAAEAASHAMTREISGAPRKPWIEESAAHRDGWTRIAHAAVSRALHDPDDPDFGARNLYETEHASWLRSEDAPNWQWEILPEAERDVYRARYTNLVAAILGEAS